MQSHQRTFLIVLIALLVLGGAGLLITSDSGNRAIHGPDRQAGPQSDVDLHPIQTAQALAPLAGPAAQPIATSPEIRAILERIGATEKSVAEMDAEIARLTKLIASVSENQKSV